MKTVDILLLSALCLLSADGRQSCRAAMLRMVGACIRQRNLFQYVVGKHYQTTFFKFHCLLICRQTSVRDYGCCIA
ncbi:hypothetical protein RchiOBHm_Chr5g0020831 [Rosa chinensis]|uniref:Secreted protein n=1 Tax=Rosa chinensis TaxID=74649 RepID=A0A2P6Q7D7_ROSCH|nr:hypothetical protein RchiOBHm_Chr5g0020831 [Rosa chinensis]